MLPTQDTALKTNTQKIEITIFQANILTRDISATLVELNTKNNENLKN